MKISADRQLMIEWPLLSSGARANPQLGLKKRKGNPEYTTRSATKYDRFFLS